MYADDNSFLRNGSTPSDLIYEANEELKLIINWLAKNKLSLNIKKSKFILFSRKGTEPIINNKLIMNNHQIERINEIKFLGYIIDEKLSWKSHVNYISFKISKNFAILKKLVKAISRENLRNLYYNLIYPYLMNGIIVWGSAGDTTLSPLFLLQKKIIRILTGSGKLDHTSPLFVSLGILPLNLLYTFNVLVVIYKIRNDFLPHASSGLFQRSIQMKFRETRQDNDWFIPKFRTSYMEKSIFVRLPRLGNEYAEVFNEKCCIEVFKTKLKKVLLFETIT